MTVKGLLLRFFVSYFGLIVVAGLALNHFGIKIGSWVNSGILIGLIFWVCMSFGQKNCRYLTLNEKTTTVLGIIAIDLLLQLLLSLPAISASNLDVGSLVFVGLLHSALICYCVFFSCEQHLRNQKIING